ncbi:ATP synthase alpha/beta family, beta-barrel domain protein, partial [Chlamydia psittaci 84-8471/1]
ASEYFQNPEVENLHYYLP